MAASFDAPLMHRVATTISDEARAKHHEFLRQGKRGIYQGLTFWTPNINIFRDPRWGRGQETYGEDPFLTGRLAVQFVRGLQGDNPKYLKTIATAKHYAVHSGPESTRHTFDARVDDSDLYDTYLPQFEAAVKQGGALSVMCAYNRFRRRAGMRQSVPGRDDPAKAVEIPGLHRFRLRGHRRHLPEPQDPAHSRSRGCRSGEGRHRSGLRRGVREPGSGGEAGPHFREGDRHVDPAAVHGAVPAGDVRPAGDGALRADPVQRQRQSRSTELWRSRWRTNPSCC